MSGRRSGFNVKRDPDVANKASGCDSFISRFFIQEAPNTLATHTACVCKTFFFFVVNLFLSAFTLSHLTLPLSPPQENISIPACNALWLRCCLYIRKHFCVLLAFCVFVYFDCDAFASRIVCLHVSYNQSTLFISWRCVDIAAV